MTNEELCLRYQAGDTDAAEELMQREDFTIIRAFAAERSYAGINRILQAIDEAKARLKANVNPELTMEMVFLAIREET